MEQDNIDKAEEVEEIAEAEETPVAELDDSSEEVAVDEAETEEDADLMIEAVEPTEEEQAAHDESFDCSEECADDCAGDCSEECTEECKQRSVGTTDELVDQFDWEIFDLALTASLGDAALTTEQRKNLPDSAFCGPERSFPVPDCAHVTAARRLIGRAKLSEAQKDKVLACVNGKADRMKCDVEKDEALTALQKDYQNALATIQDLESKLENAILRIAKIQDKQISFEEDSNRLEVLLGYFDSISNTDEVSEIEPKAVVVVEDPSISSSDASSSTVATGERLGGFEQTVIVNYNKILERDGLDAAEIFLTSQRRYLPRGFHPSKF